MIVETSTDEHSSRSQVGMASKSDCLLGQLDKILWISDFEAGVKTEKSGGVAAGWQEERVSAEMMWQGGWCEKGGVWIFCL